jgi:hypothetical protein
MDLYQRFSKKIFLLGIPEVVKQIPGTHGEETCKTQIIIFMLL